MRSNFYIELRSGLGQVQRSTTSLTQYSYICVYYYYDNRRIRIWYGYEPIIHIPIGELHLTLILNSWAVPDVDSMTFCRLPADAQYERK